MAQCTSNIFDTLYYTPLTFLQYHLPAISFFAFQSLRQMIEVQANGFPVIVVKYDPLPVSYLDRFTCLCVRFINTNDSLPRTVNRLNTIIGDGESGWPYAIHGMNNMWYANTSKQSFDLAALANAPRVRNWGSALETILRREWKFLDFAEMYRQYSSYVTTDSTPSTLPFNQHTSLTPLSRYCRLRRPWPRSHVPGSSQ